jgi:hypothetical protein
MKDGWEDLLEGVRGKAVDIDGVNFEERISSNDLLTGHLSLHADRITDVATKRLKTVMQRLGWQGPKKMKFEKTVLEDRGVVKKSVSLQGYWRPVLPGVGEGL